MANVCMLENLTHSSRRLGAKQYGPLSAKAGRHGLPLLTGQVLGPFARYYVGQFRRVRYFRSHVCSGESSEGLPTYAGLGASIQRSGRLGTSVLSATQVSDRAFMANRPFHGPRYGDDRRANDEEEADVLVTDASFAGGRAFC